MEQAAAKSAIERLFEQAQKRGGFEYLYVLVRIDGIQCYHGYKDELVSLRDWLKHSGSSDALQGYQFLSRQTAPLDLLQNLLNVANGKYYDIRPFRFLKKGSGPNAIWPSQREKLDALIEATKTSGFAELSEQITNAYRLELFVASEPTEAQEQNAAFSKLAEFLKEILVCYFSERIEYSKGPKLIKIPRSLDVLELISDAEFGLSGLRVHFSQNCTGEFTRTPQGVFGTNLEFGPPVTFLMMPMEPTSNEYRVNGKRLYEIGLPGKYNRLGEWKPIIYPGKSDALVLEARKVSQDPDVQGTLLYMLLTGHRCIEFVLRTNLDMPGEYTGTEGRPLWIWKCPAEGPEPSNRNIRLYDCWTELEEYSVEDIEQALSAIASLVNVLCFPFGAAHSWRVKYRMTIDGPGLLTPSHEDCKIVDSILKKFPTTEDAGILAAAIDWYNRGTVSTNIFNAFLCYYIALESVAAAIADGSDLGLASSEKKGKKERKAQSVACIQAKHDSLFATDPIRFVNESYFECVQSLTAKTRTGTRMVFGDGHKYLKILFEESSNGDIPLKDLRSELAHGYATLLHKGHENLIRRHLYEMGQITREFLLRVLFRLQPSDKPPSWSGAFQQSFVTADPRSTMVASDEKMFPKGTSWKIRHEWCE